MYKAGDRPVFEPGRRECVRLALHPRSGYPSKQAVLEPGDGNRPCRPRSRKRVRAGSSAQDVAGMSSVRLAPGSGPDGGWFLRRRPCQQPTRGRFHSWWAASFVFRRTASWMLGVCRCHFSRCPRSCPPTISSMEIAARAGERVGGRRGKRTLRALTVNSSLWRDCGKLDATESEYLIPVRPACEAVNTFASGHLRGNRSAPEPVCRAAS